MPDQTGWKAYDWSVLAFSFFPVALLTWGIHEFGHFAAGSLLGYEMWMTLNKAGPVQGTFDTELHEAIVAMAGPVVTWIQAGIALFVAQKTDRLWVYSAVFMPVVMRSTAMIISFVSHPNDEAKTSLILGLPIWTVPAISVSLLTGVTLLAAYRLKAGWRENLVAYIAASLVTSIVVFSDRFLFF